ncbi:hypothetical protein ES703_35648 [subsurface metagenome]
MSFVSREEGILKNSIRIAITILVNRYVSAGSSYIKVRASIGVRGMSLVIPSSAHRDTIIIIGCGVLRVVSCFIIIAGGANNGNALTVGIGEGIFLSTAGPGATEAHINYSSAIIGSKIDAISFLRDTSRYYFHRHDSGIKGYAGYAQAIIGALGYSAAEMGAVAVIVIGVGIIVNEVPAAGEIGISQIRCLFIPSVCFISYPSI